MPVDWEEELIRLATSDDPGWILRLPAAGPQHADTVGKGSDAVRKGLGLPPQGGTAGPGVTGGGQVPPPPPPSAG